MQIFKYIGPYDGELLADLVKRYTNEMGVVIEATLEDTKNPTLRKMTITVEAQKVTSVGAMFDTDVTRMESDEKLIPRREG
jgi:hypothetical protein